MDRLLIVICPDRHPCGWDHRDVVIAASPGVPAHAHDLFGSALEIWPNWLETVSPPAGPGLWVWTGDLVIDRQWVLATRSWRRPTVYELAAVADGRDPWAPLPEPIALERHRAAFHVRLPGERNFVVVGNGGTHVHTLALGNVFTEPSGPEAA